MNPLCGDIGVSDMRHSCDLCWTDMKKYRFIWFYSPPCSLCKSIDKSDVYLLNNYEVWKDIFSGRSFRVQVVVNEEIMEVFYDAHIGNKFKYQDNAMLKKTMIVTYIYVWVQRTKNNQDLSFPSWLEEKKSCTPPHELEKYAAITKKKIRNKPIDESCDASPTQVPKQSMAQAPNPEIVPYPSFVDTSLEPITDIGPAPYILICEEDEVLRVDPINVYSF